MKIDLSIKDIQNLHLYLSHSLSLYAKGKDAYDVATYVQDYLEELLSLKKNYVAKYKVIFVYKNGVRTREFYYPEMSKRQIKSLREQFQEQDTIYLPGQDKDYILKCDEFSEIIIEELPEDLENE